MGRCHISGVSSVRILSSRHSKKGAFRGFSPTSCSGNIFSVFNNRGTAIGLSISGSYVNIVISEFNESVFIAGRDSAAFNMSISVVADGRFCT